MPGHYVVTIIDAQGEGIRGTPVYDEIKRLWADLELGQDSYTGWDEEEMPEEMPATAKYIADHNITGTIMLSFWW